MTERKHESTPCIYGRGVVIATRNAATSSWCGWPVNVSSTHADASFNL